MQQKAVQLHNSIITIILHFSWKSSWSIFILQFSVWNVGWLQLLDLFWCCRYSTTSSQMLFIQRMWYPWTMFHMWNRIQDPEMKKRLPLKWKSFDSISTSQTSCCNNTYIIIYMWIYLYSMSFGFLFCSCVNTFVQYNKKRIWLPLTYFILN